MDSGDPIFTRYIAISGNYNKGTLIWDAEELLSRRTETSDVPVALYLAVGGMDEPEFVQSNRSLANVLAERDYENSTSRCEYTAMLTTAIWFRGLSPTA